ncbi:DUF1211 domain-containing protein [Microbacterium sp. cx-55]|uniref:TMEM175 family protein n=1 Tax=Microbacterium sp. cx-55 TaxID=2875948 RepID=UPI001CBF6C75|nr:TMEM175 family protein [Microbacterium sp. cx-55]MBZ4486936.1 DUF1211 domain-containing protein [Microbacterium sp. cx-55]UGB35857.1 DUF1211 domain-containing protein [Microbacterium sp. cx-55]
MIRRRSHPDSSVTTTRVAAYTDAVFAIAATLLVLDLTTRSFGDLKSNADLADALLDMWQPVLTFIVSFVILSLMWTTHVAQFEWIARIDGPGMWINNIRLLFIVLVPFTSSLSTDYSHFLLGRILLPINFFFAILMSWMQWGWAVRRREILTPGLSAAEARRGSGATLSALIISAAVVVASPWVGPWAFWLFLADGLLTRALGGTPGVPGHERTADAGPAREDEGGAAPAPDPRP